MKRKRRKGKDPMNSRWAVWKAVKIHLGKNQGQYRNGGVPRKILGLEPEKIYSTSREGGTKKKRKAPKDVRHQEARRSRGPGSFLEERQVGL